MASLIDGNDHGEIGVNQTLARGFRLPIVG